MTQSTIPRVFVSAASSDLGAAREVVNEALTRIECLPIEESVFGTEYGSIREMIARKIESCQAVVHLVGRDYGGEPDLATLSADQPRRSWTQIEYDIAREQNKKLYLLVCEDTFPFDPITIPESTDKTALQLAHRQEVLADKHLWHTVQTIDELQQQIERMKIGLDLIREELKTVGEQVATVDEHVSKVDTNVTTTRRHLGRWLVAIGLLLLTVGAGVWWTVVHQPDQVAQAIIAQQLADVNPEVIKQQLRKTIEATYQQDLQAAEKLTEWQKRDEAKRDAAAARDKRLGDVDEFLNSITSTIQLGNASPEFLELTRIIQEQGVDQALAYITSQESRLLERAEKLAAEKQRELRRTLAPLLEGVRLHKSKGELAEARRLCDKLLKQDADWLDVLHEHCWTMLDLGDRAEKYETVEVSLAHFEAAEVSAKRLVRADANSPIWQRDLSVSFNRLGDVFLTLGRTDDALTQFQDGLTIRRVLAEADPRSAEKQRDLMISHYKQGEVEVQAGRYEAAKGRFQSGIDVLDRMIVNGQNVADCQREKGVLEERIQFCDFALFATGDWESLLKADAEVLPTLLSVRAVELAKRGQLVEVAQAGAKLRDLSATAEKGSADEQQAGLLYNAACAYSLSGRLVTKDKPTPPEAEQAERKKYLDLALICLKEAVAAGYDNFEHMQQDTELAALHDLPEFKALIPMKAE